LDKGEALALVGENGAGKSTLIKVLGGVHLPEAGDILIDGNDPQIMMNKVSTIVSIVLSVALITLGSSCSSKQEQEREREQEENKGKIGVTCMDLTNPFFKFHPGPKPHRRTMVKCDANIKCKGKMAL